MRNTVKLQHLHTDELRASFDVGIKVRGLAVTYDVDEYDPKGHKSSSVHAWRRGDPLCPQSPILNNRPALYDLRLARTHRRPGRGQGVGAVVRSC